MANRLVPWSVLITAFSLAVLVFQCTGTAVPAIFILGDSTVDVGTNTYLPNSRARANFPFNGIDFPHSRPTGRFSNGLNGADFLAKFMGFKRSPPPFLFLLMNSTHGLKKHMFRGANFASGGSGLLDATGQLMFGRVIPLGEQIQQFATVRDNLTALIGPAATECFLSKSLFVVSTGSNDIFSYHGSNNSVSKQEFTATLKCTYENHLKNLYNLGARKFGIISIPPIGCCPSQRVANVSGGCLEELNDLARAFYSAIEGLLSKLASELPGMKYSLGNAYEMTINVIDNPLPFKFNEVKAACCGTGKFNGESNCVPTANLCSDRREYLFWDSFHPTQAASKLAAETLYGGPPTLVTPKNFAQLVEEN